MSRYGTLLWTFCYVCTCCVFGQETALNERAYDILAIPNWAGECDSGPIIVAVIDDGFLTTHKELKDFMWVNRDELPNNITDDDGNGYVDDRFGWDVADYDPDVSVFSDLAETNFHGTMTASIITQVAKRAFGDQASQYVKIMPVKVLSDNAPKPSMELGYNGIEYALKNGADIICMAWSGGVVGPDGMISVSEAYKRQILMLASAGNEATTNIPGPANLEVIRSVGAHDSIFKKTLLSNYGREIDLMATGDAIKAAHSIAENAYFNGYGTSAAVAQVAGCAAVLMAIANNRSPTRIMHALKSTAQPLDDHDPWYRGRMGAGRVNLQAAIEFLRGDQHANKFNDSTRNYGRLALGHKTGSARIELHPSIGEIEIIPLLKDQLSEGCAIEVMNEDSIVQRVKGSEIGHSITVNGNIATVSLSNCKRRDEMEFEYRAYGVDSTNLYCNEVVELFDARGILTDGSGSDNYSNRTSCKWIIKTDLDQRIRLDFRYLETEADVDIIRIFHGDQPLQENLVAKFSGHSQPPVIVSGTSQVLIWFLSDDKIPDSGWELHYEATTDGPGVYERTN